MTALLSPAHARKVWAKRTAHLLILAACLLPVLSFAWLGQYVRPGRDDFTHIGTYSDKAFWDAFLQAQTESSIGYSFLTVKILLDPLGYSVVQIFPALLMAALFFSITALLYRGLDAVRLVANRGLVALALGGMLLGASCAAIASPSALYAFQAAIKYSLPIVPVLLFALLLLHSACQPRVRGRRLWLRVLLGWTLCFVATGFSETFDIVLLLSSGLLLCLAPLAGGKWRRRCVPVLASGGFAIVTGILLLLSAPRLSDRAASRLLRPHIAERSTDEILAQILQAWLDHIGDPAAISSLALMLAAGLLVGMNLPKAHPSAREQARRETRLPLLLALVNQLLLIPLIWQHQSDQPIIFGRYSAGYFYVIAINLLLILGACLLLWQHRRAASSEATTAKATAYAGLAVVLLCFAPTQLRDMHWRAYLYLWLSAHSLLILLGWHVSRWLRADHVRLFAIGLGCLYVLILAGTAVVALPTNLFSGNDIPRTYTFVAHLFAWLGLAWGVELGWAFRSMSDSQKWLAAGALLLAVGLTAPIVADNVAMLPRWRTYAAEYDERFATIIELRAKGQRDIAIAPFSYDLTSYLGRAPLHDDVSLLLRYDIDSITLLET